jgi:hypothetical protein
VPNLRQSVRPAPNNPLVIRSKINRKTSPNSTPLSDDRDVARGEVSVRRAVEPARVPVPLAIVRHAGQNRADNGFIRVVEGGGRPRGLRTDVVVNPREGPDPSYRQTKEGESQ